MLLGCTGVVSDQAVPFQCSAMARSWLPSRKVPTAMQSDAETQETAENWLELSPWSGAGVTDHCEGAASACPAGSATVSSAATSTLPPRAIQRLNVVLLRAMLISVRSRLTAGSVGRR